MRCRGVRVEENREKLQIGGNELARVEKKKHYTNRTAMREREKRGIMGR